MDNTVWMIGEKNSGRIFNSNKCNFLKEITFGSFFPSKFDCQSVFDCIIGDSNSNRYLVVEVEVVEFKDNQLTVAYDNFSESPPF